MSMYIYFWWCYCVVVSHADFLNNNNIGPYLGNFGR